MSITNKDIAEWLGALGSVANAASGIVPSGPASYVAKFIGVVAAFGSALADAGQDPVAHIAQLHQSDPLLQAVYSEWDKLKDGKFGPVTAADTAVTPKRRHR